MALIATDNISRAEVVLADLLLVDPPDAAAIAAARTALAAAKNTSNGVALTETNFTGPGKQTEKKGLYALRKADLFNMLCIPPYKADGNIDPSLVAEAASYCEHRRAMLMVDPIASWVDKDAAKAERGQRGHQQQERGAVLPAPQAAQSAARQPARGLRSLRRRGLAFLPAPTPRAACGRRRPGWTPPWSPCRS
ncbi:hypothetical protein LP419_30965 [Massilia sp. H-1]|nr:hypothetical protein LP419_30965 [Massilia sp. H-1]